MTEGLLFDTPLLLPPELEKRQKEFCDYLQSARKRLDEFASRHEWGYLVDKTFVDSWEVFNEKPAFDRRLCALLEMPEETTLPATFSAALERRVLMSVTPEIYLKNYPQGHEPEAYAKLLCHEMAHRLHIRILDGNEEAMGPTWFYEGFALFAADQFSDSYKPLSHEELQNLFSEQERGDYRRYAAAFRQLAGMTDSLADLLTWPQKPDFMQRIEALIETAVKSGQLKHGNK
ncbi:MAG: hypothetical protein A2W80_11670 [Candidatus Riflebacteria bacterium GWC2_50_8]|nr:MAG: hypothetical protein A2W80_11670 [Candidatus Riflebacteria bacterium GWC2_50_8]